MIKAAQGVRGYLEALVQMKRIASGEALPEGFTYYGLEDLVLDRSDVILTREERTIESEELTEDQHRYITELIRTSGILCLPKQCYYNSQLATLYDHDERLTYVEGFASTGILPLQHAWLVIDHGTPQAKIIDLTWRDAKGDIILGKIPAAHEYMGTSEFSQETISDYVEKYAEAACLIGNWRDEYPEFKQARKHRLPDFNAEWEQHLEEMAK